ncbi:MAG: hypothetical protein ACXVC4_21030 [Bdellovibrionota bacterium]
MRKLRLARRGKGEPLAHLITAHRQFRSHVPENIGDGFLYEFNPVFRSVRDEARARGVRFTHHDYCDYFAYPLMCIDDVIDARRIPYRKNFRWLEILEKRGFNLDDLKKGELQYNYLFHESAHLIAHDEFFGRKSLARMPKNASTLLAIMLGEAFANTVECLASAFSEGEIGSFFLDANCHFRASEREVKLLRSALGRYGAETTARVLIAAFLYSNYLVERLTPAELGRVRRFAGLQANAPIDSLAKIGLQLNEKFRSVTTPLHLRKCGFGEDLPRLFAADPLRLLLAPGRAGLRRGAERLAGIAARDTRRL